METIGWLAVLAICCCLTAAAFYWLGYKSGHMDGADGLPRD